MPSGLLTLLKYVFLVVLYLFFLRVLRAVWVELREPKAAPLAPEPAPRPAPVPVGAPAVAPSAPPAPPRAAGAPGGPRVVVTAPPERRGQAFDVGHELTIGRSPGCAVALPEDTYVSSVHARLFRRDGQVWVEDLGSTNGTTLNEHPVSAPAALRPGDVVRIGRTALELVT